MRNVLAFLNRNSNFQRTESVYYTCPSHVQQRLILVLITSAASQMEEVITVELLRLATLKILEFLWHIFPVI